MPSSSSTGAPFLLMTPPPCSSTTSALAPSSCSFPPPPPPTTTTPSPSSQTPPSPSPPTSPPSSPPSTPSSPPSAPPSPPTSTISSPAATPIPQTKRTICASENSSSRACSVSTASPQSATGTPPARPARTPSRRSRVSSTASMTPSLPARPPVCTDHPSSTSLSLASTVRLSTGHPMPRLGFGVYQNYTTKDSVLLALQAGYRHIDTAQAYKSEAHVAEAVRESAVPREDVFITTKIISKFHGYEKTVKAIEQSLEKMQLDYIDLFLIHNPHAGPTLRLETYRALLHYRTLGKIRSVGVSNYGIHHLEEIAQAGLEKPSVNQIELHPYCQQRDIVQYCQEKGIVVQAYCPILRGNMEGELFEELAEKYAKDKAQILLRWSLQKGFVPLPKSATPARILSNTDLYDFPLSDDDVARIDALDKPGREGCLTWNPVDVP